MKTGGNSTISHKGTLNVSYTLDLWQRLADTADAAEWSHKATAEDLEATKTFTHQRCCNNLLSNCLLE